MHPADLSSDRKKFRDQICDSGYKVSRVRVSWDGSVLYVIHV